MREHFSPEHSPEFPANESIQRYCKELLRKGRNILAVALPMAAVSPEAQAGTPGVELPTFSPNTELHLDVNFVRPNGDLRAATFTLRPEKDGASYQLITLDTPQTISADAAPVGILSVEETGETTDGDTAGRERAKAVLDKIVTVAKEMKNARMNVKEGDVSVGWKFTTDFGRNDVMYITPHTHTWFDRSRRAPHVYSLTRIPWRTRTGNCGTQKLETSICQINANDGVSRR